MSAAVRPFLSTQQNAPNLPPRPITQDLNYETPAEMLERVLAEHVPHGSDIVDGVRLYSLDGGDGTWVFMRDEAEFTS